MIKRTISAVVAAAIGLGGVAGPGVVHASGLFDMMNPSKWFSSSDHDRWDDRYYRGGPYAWGGGPYGWGGPYGYNGWGAPWGGYPGASRTVVVVASDTTEQDRPVNPE
jgi:hypothetical protein